MGAAVPIIGKVVVSFLISKAVAVVGEKIGLSEDVAGLVGVGVGVYAGSQMINAPSGGSGATTGPEAVGMDLNYGMDDLDLSMNAPTPPPTPAIAPQAGANLTPFGSQPGDSSGLSIAGQTPNQGGLLTQGLNQTPGINPSTTIGTPSGTTADRIIDSSMVNSGSNGGGEDSWWKKLMTSGKTMDLVMAGMSGYAKAGIAKENREYPEQIAQQNEQGWLSAGTSGVNSLNPSFPSQGGGI